MKTAKISKSELKKYQIKTFSVREKKRSVADDFSKLILSYKHFENMLLILMRQCHKEKNWPMLNLLQNKVIMKAVSQQTSGGEKTKEAIATVCQFYQDNELFQAMIKHSKEQLNGHNISMIVARTKKDWDNAREQIKEYYKDKSKFKGKPDYPKQKKLSKVFNYSVPLESGKWSLKKVKDKSLGITLAKTQKKAYLNGESLYLKNKNIKSVTISTSHGHVYYNFNYIEKKPEKSKGRTKKKAVKAAGLDIGINNLAAIFIDDEISQSLIISGRNFKHYNSTANRKIAKLNTQIASEAIEHKVITTKAGDTVKIATKYSEKGHKLRFIKGNVLEKRSAYFDDQFNKLSKKILTYIKDCQVTDLVISRNLSFAKKDGKIKMRKKTKQSFYQIPFGRLLNSINQKAIDFGINVHDIDEAYTSKTSAITGDVNDIQQRSQQKPKPKFTTTDFNGSRGVNQCRGLFKDRKIDKIWNADLNGAANHIKIRFNKTDLSKFGQKLFKFCNPVKIKSVSEFDKLLSNSKAERKTTLLICCDQV